MNRVINEYIDACDDHLLHIHDNDRYVNFAQVIGGSLKMTWTEIITTHQPLIANRTDANFPTDIRHFTRRFLPSNHGLYADDYSNPSQHAQPTFSYEDQHHLDNHHNSLDHYYNQYESPENYYPNYQDYDC